MKVYLGYLCFRVYVKLCNSDHLFSLKNIKSWERLTAKGEEGGRR